MIFCIGSYQQFLYLLCNYKLLKYSHRILYHNVKYSVNILKINGRNDNTNF